MSSVSWRQMAVESRPVGGSNQLRSLKVKLIDVLSSDPDLVLQHADSRSLLSVAEYRRIKAIEDPSRKVCELLDCIMQRGRKASRDLVELLREADLQDAYPRLASLMEALQPARGAELVTEQQLMTLACGVGRSWKQIGILALGISAVKLDQLEEDNRGHVERVFAMLLTWRMREGERATAAYLHHCLSHGDVDLSPESLQVLLGTT